MLIKVFGSACAGLGCYTLSALTVPSSLTPALTWLGHSASFALILSVALSVCVFKAVKD